MSAWHYAFKAFNRFDSDSALEIIEIMTSSGYKSTPNEHKELPQEMVSHNSALMPMRLALSMSDVNQDKCFNLPIGYFRQEKGIQKQTEEEKIPPSWWDELLEFLQNKQNINPVNLCRHVGGCMIYLWMKFQQI